MKIGRFLERLRNRKDSAKVDRERAQALAKRARLLKGMDWRKFFGASRQLKRRLLKDYEKKVKHIERDYEKLENELKAQFEGGKSLDKKKKKKIEKRITRLQAKLRQAFSDADRIQAEDDACNEQSVETKKMLLELESDMKEAKMDLQDANLLCKCGAESNIFFLVDMTLDELRSNVETNDAVGVRGVSDEHSFYLLKYFVTGGLEFNPVCAAAFQGRPNIISGSAAATRA